MSRGYFGIGIYEPKFSENVGTLLRSAQAFDADFTFIIGGKSKQCRQPTNTPKTWRHIPHYEYGSWERFTECMPIERTLVAVETDGSSIVSFNHPERAVYLLGSEDDGLPDEVLSACDAIIRIPSRYCLNVSAAGSIALYDRIAKAEAQP